MNLNQIPGYMKKYLLLIVLTLFMISGLQEVRAQDGFFSNAQTLEKGAFAVGLQPVVLTAQDDFMFMGRTSYGLTHGVTGHLKVGIQDDETYFGAHLESSLASEPNSGLSVALLGGVYSYGDVGLKLGMNISKNLHPISIYTGLNYQPLFAEVQTVNALLVPVGLDLHLKKGTLDLMLEGDIPVNDDAEYLEALTFGARIYLN